jgi:hypothetical protein
MVKIHNLIVVSAKSIYRGTSNHIKEMTPGFVTQFGELAYICGA